MKIKKIIYSLRFNVLIFSLIIIFLLLNVFLPQERTIGTLKMKEISSKNKFYGFFFDILGFKDVPKSYPFLILIFLFYLQLLFFIFKFSSKVLNKIKVKRPNYENWESLKLKEKDLFFERLKKAGFKEFNLKEGKYFVLNEYSPLGFILFHISFLFLLTGGILLYYTREEIYLTIAKDQGVFLRDRGFSKIKRSPLFFKNEENFLIFLEDLEYIYEGRDLKDLNLKLKIKDGSSHFEGICKINYPLNYKSYKFYPLYKDDAFLIEIQNKEGYLMEKGIIFSNCFEKENAFYKFDVGIDAEILCQEEIKIKFKYNGSEDFLPLKENFKISLNDFEIFIKGKIDWIKFMVVKELGGFMLIIGFLLGILGIAFRFLFPKKEIFLIEDNAYFKSDYFNLSFKNYLENLGGVDGKT